ncbi:hypothetical protein ACFL1E_06935, partial [Candidatus Omnitrophota bacterium]
FCLDEVAAGQCNAMADGFQAGWQNEADQLLNYVHEINTIRNAIRAGVVNDNPAVGGYHPTRNIAWIWNENVNDHYLGCHDFAYAVCRMYCIDDFDPRDSNDPPGGHRECEHNCKIRGINACNWDCEQTGVGHRCEAGNEQYLPPEQCVALCKADQCVWDKAGTIWEWYYRACMPKLGRPDPWGIDEWGDWGAIEGFHRCMWETNVPPCMDACMTVGYTSPRTGRSFSYNWELSQCCKSFCCADTVGDDGFIDYCNYAKFNNLQGCCTSGGGTYHRTGQLWFDDHGKNKWIDSNIPQECIDSQWGADCYQPSVDCGMDCEDPGDHPGCVLGGDPPSMPACGLSRTAAQMDGLADQLWAQRIIVLWKRDHIHQCCNTLHWEPTPHPEDCLDCCFIYEDGSEELEYECQMRCIEKVSRHGVDEDELDNVPPGCECCDLMADPFDRSTCLNNCACAYDHCSDWCHDYERPEFIYEECVKPCMVGGFDCTSVVPDPDCLPP